MHGCLHFCWSLTFCTAVSSSGRIHFVDWVIFRCSTEALLLWSMWWVWLSHRVPGSLCEHDPDVLLCNGKKIISWCDVFLLWCCLSGSSCSQGVNEAVKSSQMILVESAECDLEGNLQGSVVVFILREICVRSPAGSVVMTHRQRSKKSEVKRYETVMSLEINCNIWNAFVI